jgi:starch synthase
VRDLPAALTRHGWEVTVLTPSYGMFATLPGAERTGTLDAGYRGELHRIGVFDVPSPVPGVRQVVFEHPAFSPAGPGRIYCDSEDEGPFAADASKFALFGAVAAEFVLRLDVPPDVVHLHDWHAAFYCLLRNFSARHERLQEIRTVLTIHNLAYQGTRPLAGEVSSLAAWFPDLDYDPALTRDPGAPGCINPMALAIRTADCISTVSPTYAKEILRPSDPAHGFVGGEGLELQLGNAARAGRLVGILNGIDYGDGQGRRPGWQRLLELARQQARDWQERAPGEPAHAIALDRLAALPKRRPTHVLVSIGRLVRQKVSLFLEVLDDGRTALEHIVDELGSQGAVFVLGSGEPAFEQAVRRIAARSRRLVFLRGYSESLAAPLYRGGDLFLMPSSFEPCGISQMLAMRAAQPVVAHAVGGLCDTIEDKQTGFLFAGDTPAGQARNFVAAVRGALKLRTNDPYEWQNICGRAAACRFDWDSSAEQTIEKLYAQTN